MIEPDSNKSEWIYVLKSVGSLFCSRSSQFRSALVYQTEFMERNTCALLDARLAQSQSSRFKTFFRNEIKMFDRRIVALL